MNPFTLIGTTAINILNTLGGLTVMLSDAVKWGVRKPFRGRQLIKQMEFIGVDSTPVVMLTGIFIGMVFAYQCYYGFSMFGFEEMTGTVVAFGMARELGPVVSAIMVTARCGSAMAAELGTMRVTEQIDAIYAMAVEPVQYLVAPRILAGLIMMPLLNIISVVCGILGGYFVGVKILGINSTMYIENTVRYLGMDDIMNGCIKAAVFGVIFALVGCYKGYHTSGGALGVGRATTESVVLSCVLILLFDYVLTAVMF